MRYLVIFSLFLILSCHSKKVEPSPTTPEKQHVTTIELDSTTKHFVVKQDSVIDINFELTNTGEVPLIIQSCKTSCGCFVALCPRLPIEPGKQVTIKSKFDATGKVGQQMKFITIRANTDPEITKLKIVGRVIVE